MKVLHVINTLSIGGAELHLLALCGYLKSLGVDVVVACLREEVRDSRSLRHDFESEGISVINLKATERYDISFLLKLLYLVYKERPDILHTHLPRADLAGPFIKVIHRALPWICSVHDIHSRSWKGHWLLPLFKYVWRQSDGIVAISFAVKNWLVMDMGINDEKITVIHYGIDHKRLSSSTLCFRNSIGIKDGKVVGSLGRLEERKGFDCLIRSMPSVIKHVPDARLLIAGHDVWGYGKELQKLIDVLRLDDRIQLVGFQDDAISFLKSLDAFVFPSRSEGFGLVVLEANALGIPVIASRIPPLTEIIKNNENGVLVEVDNYKAFADAISWVLTHPIEAQKLVIKGKERVLNQFMAEIMARKTQSLYQKILEGKKNSTKRFFKN
jgi:glycosyltransferase involved in cell wall biosynthesis